MLCRLNTELAASYTTRIKRLCSRFPSSTESKRRVTRCVLSVSGKLSATQANFDLQVIARLLQAGKPCWSDKVVRLQASDAVMECRGSEL